MMDTGKVLLAGSGECDITPDWPVFLYGYPHQPRDSTGTNDPLLSSALYLNDGSESVLLIANDVIFIPRRLAVDVRKRIEADTGVPAANIMVTATHTHSGPMTLKMLSNAADPAVPEPDPQFLRMFEDGIVEAARQAVRSARPAHLGLAVADAEGIGTNRHDPQGPRDTQVPVLAVRDAEDSEMIGLMFVCSMHPTVLHEDSRVISGDFLGLARQRLKANALTGSCPVLVHLGAAGDQSPRHVTRGNTLEEAARLGGILAGAVESALGQIDYQDIVTLACCSKEIDLPMRKFPDATHAAELAAAARQRMEGLQENGAARAEIRSAECDWFGAEETATLAKAAATGRIQETSAICMPAEVQLMQVGPWTFVGWPGEVFVEFALEVKRHTPDCFPITLANGELQGYLVTQDAVDRAVYESGNALFRSPDSAQRLVETTIDLLSR